MPRTRKNFCKHFSDKPQLDNSQECKNKIKIYSIAPQFPRIWQYNNNDNKQKDIQETCCLTNKVLSENKKKIKRELKPLEEILVESNEKLKNIFIENSACKKSQNKKAKSKKQAYSLVISLPYRTRRRKINSKKNLHNQNKEGIRYKSVKNVVKDIYLKKRKEMLIKGKRGLLGGKIKGKSLEKVDINKSDSDENCDNFYPYRISLGHFQQLKDSSGASTSNQHEDFDKVFTLIKPKELKGKNSEELELLELQSWGNTSLITCKRNE